MGKRVVLIDGDIELYQVATKCERDFDGIKVSDIEYAKELLRQGIKEIMEETKCEDYIYLVSGNNNYRKEYFDTYKAQRTGGKPTGYQELKDFVINEFKTDMEARLEADDLIGLYSTDPKDNNTYIIYSLDKDMNTIPAIRYDIKGKKFIKSTNFQARYFLYYQILIGDRVDNYTGLPKVGPVKANRILEGCKTNQELFDATYKAYVKYYKDDNIALQELNRQAQQARILRYENNIPDYDFLDKTIKMWEPKEKP